MSANTTSDPLSDQVLSLIRSVHKHAILRRRVRVIAGLLAERIPTASSVLDVGCGDGSVGYVLKARDPSLKVRGLEVIPRPRCLIDYEIFDGCKFPFPDKYFDVCLFVDVLHHAKDVPVLLREARRVARRSILVKDHVCENWLDGATLRLMDWVGNRPHGVVSTFRYLSRAEWSRLCESTGLRVVDWSQSLPIYPPPLSLVFGRGLHCLIELK